MVSLLVRLRVEIDSSKLVDVGVDVSLLVRLRVEIPADATAVDFLKSASS